MTLFKAVCYTLNTAILCGVTLLLIAIAFQSALRFSPRKTAGIMAIGYCIGLVVDLLILEADAPFHAYFIVGTVFLALVDVAFALSIFKKDPLQILLGTFMILTILNHLTEIATQLTLLSPLPIFLAEFPNLNYVIYLQLAFLLFLPLLIYLLCHLLRQAVEIGMDMALWRALFLMPLAFYIVSLIGGMRSMPPNSGSVQAVAMACGRCLLTIGCYVVALKMLLYAYEKVATRCRAESAEQQLALERERYEMLADHIAQTDRLLHDWRHHMIAFRAMTEQGDLAGLTDYLNELGDAYSVSHSPPICARQAVDVVLRHYLEQAQAQGIQVQHRVDIPPSFGGSDLDLCIVFGNLTENALEACLRQQEGSRFIHVNAHCIGGNILAVRVENSFDGNLKTAGEGYQSSKRRSAGLGIPSVKRVVAQCDGTVHISAENGVFTVELLLNS